MFAKQYGNKFVQYMNNSDQGRTDLIRDDKFYKDAVGHASQRVMTKSSGGVSSADSDSDGNGGFGLPETLQGTVASSGEASVGISSARAAAAGSRHARSVS